MMVKLIVYAYATGVFSSRKIERRLHEDLAFRMLTAGNLPRHRTDCDCGAFHLKELSQLFVQVVGLAREMGLVKLGTVAIDGTAVLRLDVSYMVNGALVDPTLPVVLIRDKLLAAEPRVVGRPLNRVGAAQLRATA